MTRRVGAERRGKGPTLNMDAIETDDTPLLPRLPLLLEAHKGDWVSAAREIVNLASVLRSPVDECLAAAAALEEAMLNNDDLPSAEVLFALRGVQNHLSSPSGASADARLAERNINAVRPALREGSSTLSCALACSLLPAWAAALPLGPHWASQVRVVLRNLLAVQHTASGVAAVAVLNALVAVIRNMAASNPRSVQGDPLSVSAVAAHVAASLEATTNASADVMLGVSAGLGAASLLREVPHLDEPSCARMLLALAQCVDAAAAAAAADATAAEAVRAAWTAQETPESVELVFATPDDDEALMAACAACSAALPALVGSAWRYALANAPAASLELTRALLACVGQGEHAGAPRLSPDCGGAPLAFLSDEARLAASMLLSQFCETAAAATAASSSPNAVKVAIAPVDHDVPSTPLGKISGGGHANAYESPLTTSRATVVPLVEEFAAVRGVRPPSGIVLPLPTA